MSVERLWRRGGWGGLLAVLLLLAGCRDAGAEKSADAQALLERNAALQEQVRKLTEERDQAKPGPSESGKPGSLDGLSLQRLLALDDDVHAREQTLLEREFPELGAWRSDRAKWEAIVIDEGESDEVRITDPGVLRAAKELFRSYGEVSDSHFPSGVHSPDPAYRYTVIAGDRRFRCEAVAKGLIRIDRRYVRVENDILALGEAFAPRHSAERTTTDTRMKESGLMVYAQASGQPVALFSSFRISGVAGIFFANRGAALEKRPSDPGEYLATYTFFDHGGIVEMKAYRHAARLRDGTSATWYAGKESWNFASFLNAG